MPSAPESPITRQGVRNLNLVGKRPRQVHHEVEVWHSCTVDAKRIEDFDSVGQPVIRYECRTCGRRLAP